MIDKEQTKLKGKYNMLDASPTYDRFKKHLTDIKSCLDGTSRPNKANFFNPISFLETVSFKTKYQLKIIEHNLIFSLIFPVMENDREMESATMCARIMLNIASNKSNHYKLCPESEILSRLISILLKNFKTKLTGFLLMTLNALTDNKDYISKIEAPVGFLRSSSGEQGSKSSSEIQLDGVVRNLLCSLLDEIRSANKPYLLKTVYNIFSYHKRCFEKEGVAAVIRALGDSNAETIHYAMKLIEFYSKPTDIHPILMQENLLIRLFRIQKANESIMSVEIVKIILNLFENQTIHAQLMTSALTEFIEMYIERCETELNEEVMTYIFEVLRLISKKEPFYLKYIFDRAFKFARRSSTDEFTLSCFTMINIALETYAEELLEVESVQQDVCEFIPNFFRSHHKELLCKALSIYNTFLKVRGDEVLKSDSTEKNLAMKAIINSMIATVNKHFNNSRLMVKACSILVYFTKIDRFHMHFLKEPEIDILCKAIEELIHSNLVMNKEFKGLNKLLEDPGEIFRRQADESVIIESSQSELVPHRNQRKASSRSPHKIGTFYPKSQKQTLKKRNSFRSTRKTPVDYDRSVIVNEVEDKTFERAKELSYKLKENVDVIKIVIKILTNLSTSPENLEIMSNKEMLELVNQLMVKENLDIFELLVLCLEGFSLSKSSVKRILVSGMVKKIVKLVPECSERQKEVVFKSIKVMLTDSSLQKQFIKENGICVFVSQLNGTNDKLNYFILKAIHEVTVNFSKLCFTFFSSAELALNEAGEKPNGKAMSLPEQFKFQFQDSQFLTKVLVVGTTGHASLKTHKEIIKICINLYLNILYIQEFASEPTFDKLVEILDSVLENFRSHKNYSKLVNLVLVLMKFLCEEDKLLGKFIKSHVVNKIAEYFREDFSLQGEQLKAYSLKFAYVLMNLTKYSFHVAKFKELRGFAHMLNKLYSSVDVNGKVYVIQMVDNILKQSITFFSDEELMNLKDIVVNDCNSLVMIPFVELLRVLVQKKGVARNMENVFKLLIQEMNSNQYSKEFKQKMYQMILSISNECENIKGLNLKELLTQVTNQDIHIERKDNLLLLVNFSIETDNFNFLKIGETQVKKIGNITKAEIKDIINHLPGVDKFNQILIQRLLINITSLENLDLSIITDKLVYTIVEVILTDSAKLMDSLITFALIMLVNLTNKNDSFMLFDSTGKLIKRQQTKDDLKNILRENKGFTKYNEHFEDIILTKLKGNFYKIFTKLFSRRKSEISAILILFYCNISPSLSQKSPEEDEQLSNFLSSYFLKNFRKENFAQISGKFLFYAGMRFCILLMDRSSTADKYKKILGYIYRMLFEEKLLGKKLDKSDFKDNSVNFMLEEINLKFMNILLLAYQQIKNMFPNMLDSIKTFLTGFLSNFTAMLEADVEYKINSYIKDLFLSLFYMIATFLKIDQVDFTSVQAGIRTIIKKFIRFSAVKYSHELKALFVYLVFTLINHGFETEADLLSLEMKEWIVNLFQLRTNTVQTDYYCLKLFSRTSESMSAEPDLRGNYKFIAKLAIYLEKENDSEFNIRKETERYLNLLSFDTKFHKLMFELNIFSYFKYSFMEKMQHKSKKISKQDVIFMVNMLRNEENYEIIEKDLMSILEFVLRCSEISIPIKVQLFEIIMNQIYSKNNFDQDIVVIFDLLNKIMEDEFSHMIFLLEAFLVRYEGVIKHLGKDESRIKKLYSDLKKEDPAFPSLNDELSSFINILFQFMETDQSEGTILILKDIINSALMNDTCLYDLSIVQTLTETLVRLYRERFKSEEDTKETEAIQSFIKEYKVNEFIDRSLEKAFKLGNVTTQILICNQLIVNQPLLKPLFSMKSKLYSDEFVEIMLKDCSNPAKLPLKTMCLYLYFMLAMNNAAELKFSASKLSKLIQVFLDKLKAETDSNQIDEEASGDFVKGYLFLCDLIYSSNKEDIPVRLVIDTFMLLKKMPHLSLDHERVIFKNFQDIAIKFRISSVEDFELMVEIHTAVFHNDNLRVLENLFVGAIIICCSDEVVEQKLTDINYIIQRSIQVFEPNKVINCLRYIKQLFYTFLNRNNVTGIKVLHGMIEDIAIGHDKEIEANDRVNKKMTTLRKKLKTFV